MVQNFHLPPMGFGPGSQPDPSEGPELQYLPLPSGMRTYAPSLPEVEVDDRLAPALAILAEIAAACDVVATDAGTTRQVDLTGLDAANRALVAETMGDGEVSMKCRGVPALRVQESVFAGVWQVAGAGVDMIEVAPVPEASRARAFVPTVPAMGGLAPKGPGVVNAPALIAELMDKSATWQGGTPHVVNLTLLPHTEEDLACLDAALGRGSVDILSRGYGNCRVTATGQRNVWRVQFYNSTDALILDTFEVGGMPEVAIAASEDLADSGARLREVLEAIR
ncbi:hydrogenase expression/formation protein [Rhodobacteraceae bacterium CCMM004]|nr:hydrogenase expression/formation protein [Rhodobacteraceae bacterium CCMM004]